MEVALQLTLGETNFNVRLLTVKSVTETLATVTFFSATIPAFPGAT